MYYSYNRYEDPEGSKNTNSENFGNVNSEDFGNIENDDSFQSFQVPPYCPYRHMPPDYWGYFQYDARQFTPSAPPGPPPSVAPSQPPQQFQAGGAQTFAVDPGAIRPCLHRFVYIWPRRGNGFWAWLTFVGRRSVSGFRWNGRRWIFFGMDLRDIRSFQCF